MMCAQTTPAKLISALQTSGSVSGIYLVTGERGAGKTTWLKKLVSAARQAGYQVCGLLSPGTFENGVKVAINLVDLDSGQERVMSTPIPQHLSAGKGGIRRLQTGELVLGGWQMHEDVLQWGNALLYNLLVSHHASASQAATLLVIDELGPLEFVHGLGFTHAIQFGSILNLISRPPTPSNEGAPHPIQPAQTTSLQAAFIVVRPDLIPKATRIWPQAQIIEINPTTR
jgi:nucleoside-triphosphatase THEP1